MSIINLGAGGLTLSAASIVTALATSGAGGAVTLHGGAGALTIPAGIINVSAAGSGMKGGAIDLQGTSLTVTGSANGGILDLKANATGGGAGGSVAAAATGASSTITVGSQSTNLRISATGGTGGATPSGTGNGGIVTVSAGGDVTVDPSAITAGPLGTNGAGAQYTLSAGTASAGTLLVSGAPSSSSSNVNVSGVGNGAGGKFIASENSASAFQINGGSIGTIKANAGNTSGTGGTVSVTNSGAGGISLSATADLLFAASSGGGAGGKLTLSAPSGPLNIPAGTFSANATSPGSFKGGAIALTGNTLAVSTGGGAVGVDLNLTANASGSQSGGSVSVTTTGSTAGADITVGTGSGQVNIAATGGTGGGSPSSAGDGGSATISAGRNLTVTNTASINVAPQGANGKGGSITLADGTAVSSATMLITGNLSTTGAGTGSGGNIQITYKDPTNAFQVGGSPANSGITGNITADAPSTGTGGNVTIGNGSAAPLKVNLATTSSVISASSPAATVTNTAPLGNLNFNQPGQSVDVSGPGTISGFVNSTAATININPADANTTVTVGSVNATNGPATVTATAANSIANIPLGHTASSTGDITIASGTVLINGTVTTSKPGGTVLVQNATGDEFVSGQGLFQATGGGASLIEIAAAPGHKLTLDLSPTYNPGSGGQLVFAAEGSGGQIVTTAGSNQIIASGVPTHIESTQITMGDGAAFTALSNTTYTVDSGTMQTPPLPLTLTNSGASSRFVTVGGACNVGPTNNGQNLSFTNSSTGATTMNFQGGLLTTTANNATTTIAANTTLSANSNIVMNGNAGSIINNGTLANSAANGSITLNANAGSVINNGVITNSGANSSILLQSTSSLTVGGTNGTFSDTGSGTNTITISASVGNTLGNALNLTGSQTFDPGSATGSVAFNSPNCPTGSVGSINLSSNVTETIASGASVTFTTPILSFGNLSAISDSNAVTTSTGITFNSCAGCSLTIVAPSGSSATASTAGAGISIAPQPSGSTYSLTFDKSGTTAATLNLQGGAVTTTTTYGGTVNADANVNSLVTVAVVNPVNISTGSSLTMNVNGASLNNNGTLSASNTSGTAGRITVQSTGDLAIPAIGVINVAPTAANGSGGEIDVLATSGNLTVNNGTLNANAQGTGVQNGGIINVQSKKIDISGTSTLNLNANASGTGKGGSVTVKATGPLGSIITGASLGDLQIDALGGSSGSASGDGGSITLSAGNSITLSNGGLFDVRPIGTNGKGGTISITASTATSGSVTINPSLNASGAGTGAGGSVTIRSDSSQAITVASTITADAGTPSPAAAGGSGGTISVKNLGNGTNGGISLSGNLSAKSVNASNTGSPQSILVDAGITGTTGTVSLFGGASLNASATDTGGAFANNAYNGGTILVQGAKLSIDTAALSSYVFTANGAGKGNASSSAITLKAVAATGDITVSGGAGGLSFSALGGETSGNGGKIDISAGHDLKLTAPGILNATPSATATGGNGGTINLTASTAASGVLTVIPALSVSGKGTGSGGAINLISNSSQPITVSSTLTADAGTPSPAAAGGSGGTIIVRNLGNGTNGGISLSGNLSAKSVNANNTGSPQSILIDAGITGTTGTVSLFGGASFNASATDTGGAFANNAYNSGTILVQGANLSIDTTALSSYSFTANGAGKGNASSSAITLKAVAATGDIIVSGGAGGLTFSALGGETSGNGGKIDISAGHDLKLTAPGIMNATPSATGISGNGGTINLTASTAASGVLSVTPSLSVDGKGTGSGGAINISSNSSQTISINSTLSANAGNPGAGVAGASGGQIKVTNKPTSGTNGGITINANLSATSTNATNTAALITLDATGSSGNGTVTDNGGANIITDVVLNGWSTANPFTGGNITVTGSGISFTGSSSNAALFSANGASTGNGGAVSVTATAGSVAVQPGTNGLNLSATGGSSGSSAGNGGTISVLAGANLTVAGGALINAQPLGNNGTGGNLTFKAGTAGPGLLQVNQALAVAGKGTGNGGTITVGYNDSTNPLTVGANSGVTQSWINGTLKADADSAPTASGSGGTVTVLNTGSSNALNVTLTQDITANKSTAGSLGTLNFKQTGQSVNVAGPANLTGTVNSDGSTININPQAAATTLTVGTIKSTNGDTTLTVSCPDSTINIPSGSVAQATNSTGVKLSLNGGIIVNNGSATSSGSVAVKSDNLTNNGTLQANAGNLTIDKCSGNCNVTLGSSSTTSAVGGAVNFNSLSAGAITVTGQGAISGTSVGVNGGSSAVSLNVKTITGNVTGLGTSNLGGSNVSVQVSTGAVTIGPISTPGAVTVVDTDSTVGAGNILTAGTGISAGTVEASSTAGSIGTSGSPVALNAATVTLQAANATQNVYANDTAAGTITLVKDSGNSVDNIAGSTYSFTANNGSSLLTGSGEVVKAGTVLLSATNGSIGTTCTSPFFIDSTALTANAAGSGYFSDSTAAAAGVTITSSTVGTSGTFYLVTTSTASGAGKIATGGTGITGTSSGIAGGVELVSTNNSIGVSGTPVLVKAASLTLQANATGQNVYANNTATGTITMNKDSACNCDNSAAGTYSVTANSATSVLTGSGETVTAGSLILSASAGGIGTSGASPYSVNAPTVQATAGTSAFFADSYSSTTTPITVNSSTVATTGTFYLLATSATAGAGSIATSGTGITAPTSGIAGTVELASTSGSVGTSTTPVLVKAANLTLKAAGSGQNVFANDTAAGTITVVKDAANGIANTAGATYSLTANSATSLLSGASEKVSAGTAVILSATGGAIGTSIASPFAIDTTGLTATASTSAFFTDSSNSTSSPITISNSSVGTAAGNTFFLNATSATSGAGNIVTGGTGITGTTNGIATIVELASTSGSIGTSSSPITVKAANLTMQANASGQNVYLNDSASGTVNFLKDSTNGFDNIAGNVYSASVNSATSVLTGAGETVTASSVVVNATGGTIGTSCTSPYAINTANLTANASGSAFFSDSFSSTTTPITISSSTVGTAGAFFFKATAATAGAGNIVTAGTGITGTTNGIATKIDLLSTAGSIGTSTTPVLLKAASLALQANGSGQNVFANDTATGTITMVKDTTCSCDNLAGSIYNVVANSATSLLTGAGETVTAGSINLGAAAGTIGTSATSTYSINTTNLTANAQGSAFFSDANTSTTTPITVSGSTVGSTGTFFLRATSATAGAGSIAIASGGLTSSTGGTINTVELVSTAGSIGASTTPVSVDAANVTLQANGATRNVYVTDIASGVVTAVKDTAGGFANGAASVYSLSANNATSVLTGTGETVTAGSVALSATGGTIGTSCTSPFAINTTALTAVAQGSAFFSDSTASTATPITITSSTVGATGTFYLGATSATAGAGSIATGGTGISATGGATANKIELMSTAGSVGTSGAPVSINGANIALQANGVTRNVYATNTATGTVTLIKNTTCNCDNLAASVYSLTANNASFVLTGSGETVTAGSILLTANGGTIGTSSSSPFSVNTTALTARAQGSAYFADSTNSTATPITITSSNVGSTGTFSLVATSTTAGAGSIATAGTGITTSSGGTVGTVELVSTSGSVGASTASRVLVNAANFTLQANGSGQNVFANDTASGTVTAVADTSAGFANGAGSIYDLTANSASSLLTAAGETVTAGTVKLSANAGTIGTSCTSPFAINTTALTAAASGSAFFSDSTNSTASPITITSSTVGATGKFYLKSTSTTSGAGNIATGGTGISASAAGTVNTVELVSVSGSIGTNSAPVAINAANIALQANASAQNVYATNAASGTVTAIKDITCNCDNLAGNVYSVTSNSASSLLSGSGETVTAATIVLSASAGTIGTSVASPFAINTTALTSTAGGSSFYADSSSSTTSPITISNSTVGASGKFYLQSTSSVSGAGNVVTGGTGITATGGATADTVELASVSGSIGTSSSSVLLNAAKLTLQASGVGQNVYANDTAGGTVTMVNDSANGIDNRADNVYNVSANTATALVTGAAETVTAGSVALSATNGTIGTSVASPYAINTIALTATAKNSAFFTDSSSNTSSPITISNSSVGTSSAFYFNATSTTTGAGNIGTSGTGIAGTSGGTASTVELVSAAGSIGSSSSSVQVNAANLTLQANASSQNVYVTDSASGTVTMLKDATNGFDNSAAGTYSVSANNATSVLTGSGEVVNAGTVILSATSGTIGGSIASPYAINTSNLTETASNSAYFSDSSSSTTSPITITSSSVGGGTFFLNATSSTAGAGNIATGGTGITGTSGGIANTVELVSAAGSIGTSSSSIQVKAANLTLQASSSGKMFM